MSDFFATVVIMRTIKFTRDEANHRIYYGKVATYRVVDAHGPWVLEIHPTDGMKSDDARDDSGDAPLLTLREAKVFIGVMESGHNAGTAYGVTLAWRNTTKS